MIDNCLAHTNSRLCNIDISYTNGRVVYEEEKFSHVFLIEREGEKGKDNVQYYLDSHSRTKFRIIGFNHLPINLTEIEISIRALGFSAYIHTVLYYRCDTHCHGLSPPGLFRFRLFLSRRKDRSNGSFLFGILCKRFSRILFNLFLCSSLCKLKI